MEKPEGRQPDAPLMIAEVVVPRPFIEWAAGTLYGRGFDRVDPSLIAFIFREVIDRTFSGTGRQVNLDEAVETAIELYDFALTQLREEHLPPDDEAWH